MRPSCGLIPESRADSSGVKRASRKTLCHAPRERRGAGRPERHPPSTSYGGLDARRHRELGAAPGGRSVIPLLPRTVDSGGPERHPPPTSYGGSPESSPSTSYGGLSAALRVNGSKILNLNHEPTKLAG